MAVRYAITYDKVTPESADNGDYSESGWYMAGGWEYPCPDGLCGPEYGAWVEEQGFYQPVDPADPDDLNDGEDPIVRACAEIVREYGGYETDDGTSWYCESEQDYHTGEDTTKCIHFEGLSTEQAAALIRLVK